MDIRKVDSDKLLMANSVLSELDDRLVFVFFEVACVATDCSTHTLC